MIEKTIKLEISLPLQAEITAHADVDLDFSAEAAVEAVKQAIKDEAEGLRFMMLAESERLAREWREDQMIEEALNRR
jgi:hypothetical protein